MTPTVSRAAVPSQGLLLITPADAAKALSISPRTLWGLTHRGEVPCVRIGRLVRYDPRDLTRWINEKKEAPS